MAVSAGQTITFNQATYAIDPPSRPTDTPPTGLVVTDTVLKVGGVKNAGYLLQNFGNTTVTNLKLNGENAVASGLNISVRGPNDATTATATTSLFNFGTTNDTLIIGSSLTNTANMGNGNDSVTVNYLSSGDTFNLGTGADKVVFGGNILNTTVNLGGNDSSIDRVLLSQSASNTIGGISGLKITGAEAGDVLFIGTTQYNYQSSTGTGSIWVNSTNPSDTKNYS
jgi:hypothetical protein